MPPTRCPVKVGKVVKPCDSAGVPGTLLDTQTRLPEDKLEDISSKWLSRRSGKKRNGTLVPDRQTFPCGKIIVPGRIFLRHMRDTTHKAKHLDHWVHLDHNFKSDLAWWHTFVEWPGDDALSNSMSGGPGGKITGGGGGDREWVVVDKL